jgi:carbon monoxide dehydrogenase subunit G
VVGCVPGAALTAEHEDGSFDGTMTVSFGPTKVTFKARVSLELDNDAMKGNVPARGKDTQGGTRMKTSLTFTVAPEGSGSSVVSDGQVELTGPLSSMIEGGASVVVKRMSSEFASNLAKRCATQAR